MIGPELCMLPAMVKNYSFFVVVVVVRTIFENGTKRASKRNKKCEMDTE